jgi:hypothetical protein
MRAGRFLPIDTGAVKRAFYKIYEFCKRLKSEGMMVKYLVTVHGFRGSGFKGSEFNENLNR